MSRVSILFDRLPMAMSTELMGVVASGESLLAKNLQNLLVDTLTDVTRQQGELERTNESGEVHEVSDSCGRPIADQEDSPEQHLQEMVSRARDIFEKLPSELYDSLLQNVLHGNTPLHALLRRASDPTAREVPEMVQTLVRSVASLFEILPEDLSEEVMAQVSNGSTPVSVSLREYSLREESTGSELNIGAQRATDGEKALDHLVVVSELLTQIVASVESRLETDPASLMEVGVACDLVGQVMTSIETRLETPSMLKNSEENPLPGNHPGVGQVSTHPDTLTGELAPFKGHQSETTPHRQAIAIEAAGARSSETEESPTRELVMNSVARHGCAPSTPRTPLSSIPEDVSVSVAEWHAGSSSLPRTLSIIMAVLKLNSIDVESGYDIFDFDQDGWISLRDLRKKSEELCLELMGQDIVELFQVLVDPRTGFVSREAWAENLTRGDSDTVLRNRGVAPDNIHEFVAVQELMDDLIDTIVRQSQTSKSRSGVSFADSISAGLGSPAATGTTSTPQHGLIVEDERMILSPSKKSSHDNTPDIVTEESISGAENLRDREKNADGISDETLPVQENDAIASMPSCPDQQLLPGEEGRFHASGVIPKQIVEDFTAERAPTVKTKSPVEEAMEIGNKRFEELFFRFSAAGAGLGGMFSRSQTMDFGEFLQLLKHLKVVPSVRRGVGYLSKTHASAIFQKANHADAGGNDDEREFDFDEYLVAMNIIARRLRKKHAFELLWLKTAQDKACDPQDMHEWLKNYVPEAHVSDFENQSLLESMLSDGSITFDMLRPKVRKEIGKENQPESTKRNMRPVSAPQLPREANPLYQEFIRFGSGAWTVEVGICSPASSSAASLVPTSSPRKSCSTQMEVGAFLEFLKWADIVPRLTTPLVASGIYQFISKDSAAAGLDGRIGSLGWAGFQQCVGMVAALVGLPEVLGNDVMNLLHAGGCKQFGNYPSQIAEKDSEDGALAAFLETFATEEIWQKFSTMDHSKAKAVRGMTLDELINVIHELKCNPMFISPSMVAQEFRKVVRTALPDPRLSPRINTTADFRLFKDARLLPRQFRDVMEAISKRVGQCLVLRTVCQSLAAFATGTDKPLPISIRPADNPKWNLTRGPHQINPRAFLRPSRPSTAPRGLRLVDKPPQRIKIEKFLKPEPPKWRSSGPTDLLPERYVGKATVASLTPSTTIGDHKKTGTCNFDHEEADFQRLYQEELVQDEMLANSLLQRANLSSRGKQSSHSSLHTSYNGNDISATSHSGSRPTSAQRSHHLERRGRQEYARMLNMSHSKALYQSVSELIEKTTSVTQPNTPFALKDADECVQLEFPGGRIIRGGRYMRPEHLIPTTPPARARVNMRGHKRFCPDPVYESVPVQNNDATRPKSSPRRGERIYQDAHDMARRAQARAISARKRMSTKMGGECRFSV